MEYYFSKKIDASFDDAIEKVTAALKERGFGVLTEIDVKATLKKKIDVDFHPYRILGACSPTDAHKALQVENKIGTMLPCNVIVQQTDDGRVEVAAIDPAASMQAVENSELEEIAGGVRDRLKAVIDEL
jgi:uncharacterized protein (DUF302 family)